MNRIRQREWIDDPSVPDADLRANLVDQMRLNRLLGGLGALVRLAAPVFASRPGAVLRILDAGCGGGDVARSLVAEARRRSRPVEVVALDRSLPVLRAARGWTCDHREIHFVRGDVTALPIGGAEPFDLTVCANTLHHLDPTDLVAALGNLATVTRGRLIVADLRRSALAERAFPLLAVLLNLHSMSRHDGRVSLRNALTAGELGAAARPAGLAGARVLRRWFRLELIWDRPATPSPHPR